MKLIIILLLMVFPDQHKTDKKGFIEMPSIFSNNMVLQRKSDVPVWGKATPEQKVTVKASWGKEAKSIVKPDSSWEVHLKTVGAGGPYKVTITIGDSVIIYKNVMLGDVWLCSGQSNMQIPLGGWPPQYPIQNSSREIGRANYHDIRLFTVAKSFSAAPKFNEVGKWNECTPATTAHFSAVGYFFGRTLYRKLHVPIGLICSAWGGTKIQPWISGKYLSRLPYYKPAVAEIDSIRGQFEHQKRWMKSHPVVDIENHDPQYRWQNLNLDDSKCSQAGFDDSAWKSMKLPAHWSRSIGVFYGAVWFRKTVEIPQNWIGKPLVIDLGPISDFDEAWVNGVNVGGHFGGGLWSVSRIYQVPGNIVKDRKLTIAVRVIANGGGGGITGKAKVMQIHPAGDATKHLSLAGEWKYCPVAEYRSRKFYIYGTNGEFYSRPRVTIPMGQNTPTALFNGMIAPLIPFRIKGVIWYQGESNSSNPSDYNNYKYLFPMLIRNWRSAWGEGDFPFYWVQIAPFKYGRKSKSYVVRNAQRLTLSLPNTGMAVTLDIGNPNLIHPSDKQYVGHRLALWALAKEYGRHVVFSGPLYKSMKIRNGKVILSFMYVDGGLIMKPINHRTNFIIAGRDGNFVKADVKVDGGQLVVYSPKVKHPVAVRYAWSNAEQATLFNKAGLPASTFRTDNRTN